MANAKNDPVSASDFNTLFTRLEEIRQAQYNRADINSSQRANISETITGPAKQDVYPQPSDIELAKTKLQLLANNGTGISSAFASNVRVPSVGDLLEATTLANLRTNIDASGAVCANCSFFTSASNQGNYSPNYSSNFRTNFGANHRSNFGSNFGSPSRMVATAGTI